MRRVLFVSAAIAFASTAARAQDMPLSQILLDGEGWTKADAKPAGFRVATPLGVQVYDPTGQLCGVLSPSAPGSLEFLAFEGDKLTAWHGDTKYERKLNATGAK